MKKKKLEEDDLISFDELFDLLIDYVDTKPIIIVDLTPIKTREFIEKSKIADNNEEYDEEENEED